MKIFWTPIAEESNLQNLNYLFEEWSNNIALDYLYQVELTIEQIRKHPFSGIFTPRLKCYRILVVSQIYLLYEVDEKNQTIVHLKFSNNYQKPIW